MEPLEGDNDYRRRVVNIVSALRAQHTSGVKFLSVIEGSPEEVFFYYHLIEDRGSYAGGSFAFPEYMNHVQRLAQAPASLTSR